MTESLSTRGYIASASSSSSLPPSDTKVCFELDTVSYYSESDEGIELSSSVPDYNLIKVYIKIP